MWWSGKRECDKLTKSFKEETESDLTDKLEKGNINILFSHDRKEEDDRS